MADISVNDKAMLYLLRCSLNGETPDEKMVAADVEWNAIIQSARRQSVSALVGQPLRDVIDMQPERPDSEAMAIECTTDIMSVVQNNNHLNKVLAEVTEVLRNGDLNPILLKGQGVARYYPRPLLRSAGDIDYYIGTENIDHAVDLLSSHFPNLEFKHLDEPDSKHVNTEIDDVEIELHRLCVNKEKDWQPKLKNTIEWSERQMREAEERSFTVNNILITVPTPMFDVVFILYHTLHHFLFGGVGLRQVCDWMMCMRHEHDNIDETLLISTLERLDLMRVWHVFAAMAVDWLGLKREECLLYDAKYTELGKKLLIIILSDGKFGKEQYIDIEKNLPKGFLNHKYYTMSYYTRFWLSRIRVFPSHCMRALAHFYKNSLLRICK
ncbi:MAG: nucleotidyltransferase family protein [Prevotella sp.]|nr:nucleotidyltransferase family protein [Prevotella sp.]